MSALTKGGPPDMEASLSKRHTFHVHCDCIDIYVILLMDVLVFV